MSSQKLERFFEFEQWLAQKGMGQAEMARSVRYPKSTLNRLLAGQIKRIDPVLQRRIAIATQGEIGADAFAAFSARLASILAPEEEMARNAEVANA